MIGIPVLNNFFNYHPDFKYKYFLGDAVFDAIENYEYLYKNHDMIPIIPLNPSGSKDIAKPSINKNDIHYLSKWWFFTNEILWSFKKEKAIKNKMALSKIKEESSKR